MFQQQVDQCVTDTGRSMVLMWFPQGVQQKPDSLCPCHSKSAGSERRGLRSGHT